MRSMATSSDKSNSAQKIVRCLRGYSLCVEHWAPDMGETSADVGYRQALHDLRAELSPEQRQAMAVADARAIELHTRHKGQPDPYFDIGALGEIVSIIETEHARSLP